MKRIIILISLLYSNHLIACQDRIYPDNLPKNEIDQYSEIHEVLVQKKELEKKTGRHASPFTFQGKVIRELKGSLKSGEVFQGETDSWNKAGAGCPISLNEGYTYLLFMNKNKASIELRGKGSLSIIQSDPKYKAYIEDIRKYLGDSKKKVKIDPFIISGERVGPIEALSSEKSLIKALGKGNVSNSLIDVGEGDLRDGAILLTDDKEVSILWGGAAKKSVTEVRIENGSTYWKTKEGIKIGTTLEELNKLNGKPFKMFGFCWDYSGSIIDWKGGKLQKLLENVGLSLSPEKGCEGKFVGEKSHSSDDPDLRKLNPQVYEIRVRFQ